MSLNKMVQGVNYDTTTLRENVNGLISTPQNPANSKIVFIGDSITEGESSGDAFSRIYGIQSALKGKALAAIGFNQGVGGDTTQDVLDRITTIGAAMQDVCDIQIGTNDISARVPVEQFKQNLNMIINAAIAYGAKAVIAHSIPLKSTSATFPWDAEQKALRESYNTEIAAIDRTGVIIDADSVNVITDPDTMYVDGTHLSLYGSLVFGAAQARYILDCLNPQTNLDGLISNNLFSNPTLQGESGSTGGVASGVVADGWTVGSNMNGRTVACSKSNNVFGDFTESQKITISGVSSSNAEIAALKQTVTIPVSTEDDVYVAMLRYKVESSEGLSNIATKIINNVFESIHEAKTVEEITNRNPYEGFITTSVVGVMAAGVTQLNLEFNIRAITGQNEITVHFDSPILRKVN